MTRTRATGASLIALVAVLAAALTAAALLTPRPWALRVGAPGDAYFLTNTFPPEQGAQPLRWTLESSELRLYGAYAGPAALELRLYSDAAGAAGRPWPLELRAEAGTLAAFEAAPGWRRYLVALPAGATAAPITLTSPTFTPGAGDARALGVALSALHVTPLTGEAPLGYALARGLWLGCVLALAGAAVWLLDAWSLGLAGVPGRPWRALALTGGLAAALVAWCWLSPSSLAWALPTRWWAVVAGLVCVLVGTVWSTKGANVWSTKGAKRAKGANVWSTKGAKRAKGANVWSTKGAKRAKGANAKARRREGVLVLVPLGLLALAHAALFAPLPVLWRHVAALAILLAPGALAALALLWDEADPAERVFVGAAGALGVAALLVLAIHALPGAPPAWALLLAANGLSAAGLWALWTRRGAQAAAHPARPHRWLALPLLLGAALRLWGLGVSQFQGDEAYALLLARGVLHGQADVLLVHMKGPVEALLPAGPLILTGTIAEASARLPFALAGLALIIGAWCLAGRLLGGRAGNLVGFVAALAVASDGLLVAFGRIVQYQTVVLLMAAAALWLCWRFAEGAPVWRTLPAAALCAAVALLSHYDGIYVTPALAWLVLVGGRRRGWRARQWAAALAAPIALGLALTLSFYVPFVLHEHFGRTLSHLETRSGQGGALMVYNNLPGYAALLSVYATTYVAAFASLALLGTLAALLARYLRPAALGRWLAALLIGGALLALLAPSALALGPDSSLAALLVAPPLLALAVAPRLPSGLRALVLWLSAALLAHAFLLADPRTHFYTAHLPGWLLVGWGLAQLWDAGAAQRAVLRGALVAIGAAALTLGLAYTGMVFLRPWPEYERAYPATLLPLFTPPTGEVLPDDGIFGFPARDGWKVVAALFDQGVLRGSIDSNQELFTSGWYLRGQFKCQRDPDYFLTANGVTPLYIPPGYSLFGSVSVDGVRALEIYSRAPVAGPPQRFDAADYSAAFDAAPVPDFPLRRLLSGVVPQMRVEAAWAGNFALRGFDLDRATLGPDDPAFLTLYWRAGQALPATLAPAVVIHDATGRSVGEAAPFCGGMPPSAWQRTYVNDTPFKLTAAALPPGQYTLLAGVRNTATGAWQPLADGQALQPLTTITILP